MTWVHASSLPKYTLPVRSCPSLRQSSDRPPLPLSGDLDYPVIAHPLDDLRKLVVVDGYGRLVLKRLDRCRPPETRTSGRIY